MLVANSLAVSCVFNVANDFATRITNGVAIGRVGDLRNDPAVGVANGSIIRKGRGQDPQSQEQNEK